MKIKEIYDKGPARCGGTPNGCYEAREGAVAERTLREGCKGRPGSETPGRQRRCTQSSRLA